MKTTANLQRAIIMIMFTAFCCSIGNAQIIYSNNFALGTGVNISNTPPTYAATYAGGISSARWLDVNGSANTHGPLLDNGINNNNSIYPNYWALPFKPQTNHVYLLTVVLGFTNNPGVAAEFGFSINTTLTNYSGDGRFNGGANGYDWMGPLYSAGNPQFFAGNKAANALANASNIFPAGTPSTNTFQILLDTRGGTNWVAAGCINGVGVNGTFTYPPNLYVQVTNLTSVGISQNGTATLPSAIQYQSFVLETTLKPFIVQQPTPSAIASGGRPWTNQVTVLADTNGGTLSYQWYANGAPLVNGVGNVSGANTNVLVINPILTVNQLTNYYVMVTNNYGSATSALSSVTVLTNPVVTVPVASSNSVTLFSGSGGNVGSSPTFSISASGAPSLDYRWYTNGVEVGGATTINANSSSVSFANLQTTGLTTCTCIVSNGFGEVTNTWYATYIATPTAAYPQAVLSDIPFDFWRLNESDDTLGNKGALCHDYQSGNNGVYTNMLLGQTGYNPSEPAETSAEFGTYSAQYSYAGRIRGADFATASGSNAEFTVEAWAKGFADNAGSPVVTEGTYNVDEEFGLGSSTNGTTLYQFYVRAANGTVFKAVSSIPVNDFAWHHLVGVCDQANTNLTLYIDGLVAAKTSIPAGSGIKQAAAPLLTMGAGIASGQTDYGTSSTLEFVGYIADVATYKNALSVGQIINHYASVPGNFVPVYFTSPLPPVSPATFAYLENRTLTIPMTVAGSGPFGYYWTNVTTGGAVISSGQTGVSGSLAATLTIPNAPRGLDGDQLELVVTNAGSSTNLFVTLFCPAAPLTLDYSNPILYSNNFNGGTWAITGMPLTAANTLVGGTNATWVDALGTNAAGGILANGVDASPSLDSWELPFKPHAGYIYTISASLTFSGNPANWVGLGFAQNVPTNAALGFGRFSDGGTNAPQQGPNGYDWLIMTESSGALQYFAGPGGGGQISSAGFTAGVGTHAIQIVLDTTGAQWKAYAWVDGLSKGTNTYAATNLPPIGAVGISQTGPRTPGFVQWNSFVLTQTAPGGVPPYLLDPQPPTSILLANGTITIPATAFGSAPFGYYWTNNSTVVASGLTNNMAPLPASLSVSSSSLSAGQLQLVLTNAYGTNITVITLVSPINPNPGIIQYSLAGNQLTLSWPTNLGWTLQAQTNSLSVGIGTNWVNVANSSTTNQVQVPVNATNGSVFYRLILP
ncbi:MAG TPA: LamG domain-containing protein [Verrucomicrobiae bacterium]|nr:LamG domain-containing protein [Verrucomicrobiae bacterium]